MLSCGLSWFVIGCKEAGEGHIAISRTILLNFYRFTVSHGAKRCDIKVMTNRELN
jgi:hypothetical protein